MDSIQYRLQSTSKTSILYYAGLVIISIALIITTIMGAIHVHSTYTNTPMCVVDGPTPFQLPRTVIPLTYNLHLKPDMKTFKYDATVAIKLKVLQRTKCVVLNYEDLDFASKDITLTDSNGKSVKLEELRLDPNATRAYMKFARMFGVDEELSLHIAFKAKLRDDLQGFYKSTHVTKTGETKVIATTQFESESARTAFPCFDEPSFKAKFTVSIEIKPEEVRNENLKVLANMPEEKRTVLADGSVIVLFQETPLMSTYLLAYIIGEFDYVEATNDEGLLFRVYSLPGDGHKGQFMLGVAQAVTKYFNEYFDIKYPLPKMDLIGIPDFRAGAMENYGLITFRANYLLVDNETAPADIESFAEVVAHEIAHQWTGNLITANWWSHIWLNEGSATFFETLALDAVHPEWNRWEAKLTNSIQRAFAADAQPSTHPIVNAALTPDEVESVFDTITYDKGGSFLLMAYHYLGAEVFRNWFREYFKTYKWTNTLTPQLFAVLEQVTKREGIAQKFSTWTYNAGFPLVTVKKVSDTQYSLSQSRFYSNRPDGTKNTTDPLWWIPVSATLKSGETKRIELNEKQLEKALTVQDKQWFKLNTQHGFYRVNYPSENWLALFDNFAQFNTFDKFGIVDDAFALTFSGDLNIKLALRLISALEEENTYIIWDTALTQLNRINKLIAREPIGANYARMILDLIEEKYAELGWPTVNAVYTPDQVKLRTLILSTAVTFGSRDAIEKSYDLFLKNVHNGEVISPEVRSLVYRAVVHNYGEAGYYSILDRFMSNETDSQERNRLMYALAWAKDPALIKKSLELSLSPHIRSQDCVYFIVEVARNPYGMDLAWEFAREYYNMIVAKAGQRTVSARLVPGVISAFNTRTRYNEAKVFFEPKGIPALDVALEGVVANEQFLKRSYNDLRDFLKEEYDFKQHE